MIDYQKDNERDREKIFSSWKKHPRKIVIAGPGTGKSSLFKELIKRYKEKGKNNFLAITFVGKLADELADDLAGSAETRTLHSFAAKVVKENWEDSVYFQDIDEIIREDLKINNINTYKTGDSNYKERTIFYKAIGDNDAVHYALKTLKNKKKPEIASKYKYDLVLIDEFQDFKKEEAELVDILAAQSSNILIVGDDDQALYSFRGSRSKYIRDRYSDTNSYYKDYKLKYCYRCTETIIKAFKNIVDFYTIKKKKLKERVKKKEYVCFEPAKREDNLLNKKIICATISRYEMHKKIKHELSKMLKKQKIKSVLILGEARKCKGLFPLIARKLEESGFKNIELIGKGDESRYIFNKPAFWAYKTLVRDPENVLAWRVLLKETNYKEKEEIILKSSSSKKEFIDAIPEDYKKEHLKIAKTLRAVFEDSPSKIKKMSEKSISQLGSQIVAESAQEKDLLVKQIKREKGYLPRPLANLDIKIGSILKAKGLGADVVFIVGFDQDKLPMDGKAEDSDIHQVLVAITRAKKRVYLINTRGRKVSEFVDCIDPGLIRQDDRIY